MEVGKYVLYGLTKSGRCCEIGRFHIYLWRSTMNCRVVQTQAGNYPRKGSGDEHDIRKRTFHQARRALRKGIP